MKCSTAVNDLVIVPDSGHLSLSQWRAIVILFVCPLSVSSLYVSESNMKRSSNDTNEGQGSSSSGAPEGKKAKKTATKPQKFTRGEMIALTWSATHRI